jgi:succinoglycan biosynthesis protein ExoA
MNALSPFGRIASPSHGPTVTIAIPTYNEAARIEAVIHQFLASPYPHILEILVADSNSTDDTTARVQALAQSFPQVRYLHNVGGLRATGLNLMLTQARGDIFLRADAHSEYATDYATCCVEALQQSQAKNVGGQQRAIATTPFQAGVALAYYGFFGNGGAKYRRRTYTGYATTVYLGCFWREELLRCGGYTTDILSEDAELNLWLIHRAQSPHRSNSPTKDIYISDRIRVWYYPRHRWPLLWQQYFNYGRGRYLLVKKYPNQLQLRGQMPFWGLLALAIAVGIDAVFCGLRLPWLGIGLGVLLCPFLEGLYLTLRLRPLFHREIWRGLASCQPRFAVRAWFCGVALLTMPLAHGCGYACQRLATAFAPAKRTSLRSPLSRNNDTPAKSIVNN